MGTRGVAFLATSDATKSRHFYEHLLGLRFVEEHEFALVFDAYGTQLRVQKTVHVVVAPYTAFGLQVDDITAHAQALLAKGVAPKRYPGFNQDDLAIWTAPGGARVLWFEDPDGQLISLSQVP